jgi:hypothetical protein
LPLCPLPEPGPDRRLMTPLETAGAACAQQRWCEAFDHFSDAANAAPLEAPDLPLFATAVILLGRDAEGVDLQTRAHEAFREVGEVLAAGRIAAWIAVFFAGLASSLEVAAGLRARTGSPRRIPRPTRSTVSPRCRRRTSETSPAHGPSETQCTFRRKDLPPRKSRT